jgi:hypothetical protein
MKRAFRAERLALLERFDEANALADIGDPAPMTLDRYLHRSGLTQQEIWTPANILSFVRSELLPTLANKEQVRSRYSIWPAAIGMVPNAPLPSNLKGQASRGVGYGNRAGIVGLYRHFVPTYQDLVPFAAEVMCLEGWNPQCVMDLDRDSCFADTIDGDLMSLQAKKARASGKVVTSFTRTNPNSTFDIVSTAIHITAQLHACVEAELASMTTTAVTVADQPRLDLLKSLSKRVWLVLMETPVGVGRLRQDSRFLDVVNDVLARRGVTENGRPAHWDSRRLRDGRASDVYDCEKSLEHVKIALHHDSVNLSDIYLTTPSRSRSQNEYLVSLYESLSAFENWPRVPEGIRHAAASAEIISSQTGLAWLRRNAHLQERIASLYSSETRGASS